MICDLCDFHVAHTYCCGFGNNLPEDDWICGYCNGMISDDLDDLDEDDYDEEISNDELSFLNGGGRDYR
jgi:hypothetical protein